MTTREADKLIRAGVEVKVRSAFYGEEFTALFVSRDRRLIRSSTGGVYERADLILVG